MRETSSPTSTSSRISSVEPASMRESSSRSITIWSNRRTCPTTTSSACWVRSGRSARRRVEHLDRGCQRGDGRAQLVADVGREAGLAFEPGLHRVGHLVERLRQPGQVGVGFRRHAGVEAARGDLAGGGGDSRERSQQASAGPPAERAGEQGRDRRADAERGGDGAQSAVGVPQAESPRSTARRRREC